MTPTTNLLAEIEAVRKRHAFDQNNYELTASESGLGYLSSERGPRQHSDRALLLQALDGLIKGLSEDALAEVLFNLTFGGTSDPTLTEMAIDIARSQARAIRASLGIENFESQAEPEGEYSYVLSADEMAVINSMLRDKVTQEQCDIIEHVFRKAKVKWYETEAALTQGGTG